MRKIKKYFTALCSLFLTILLSISISAEGISWSIKREKDHRQPQIDSSVKYISEYDAFYLDTKASDENKVIYLTFDAGYENGNIKRILDVLKKHDVTGAFFVLEHLVTANTDLVKRMVADGHLVCNHTAKHPDMSKINNRDAFKAELEKLESIYRDNIGCEISKYYRPPEGKFTKQNLEYAMELGYKTIFWSFAYADWDNNNQPSYEYAIQKVKDNTHNGMVALLHPTSKTNADILDELISYWKEEGYRFGTLDELTSG